VGGYYTVKQGENLDLIAVCFGFADCQPIYDHPNNAELKGDRDNPDVLYPQDRVFIPELRLREEPCATDQLHSFTMKGPKKMLRVAVQDSDGNKLTGVPYELTIEATPRCAPRFRDTPKQVLKSQIDSSGVVECPIPINASSATLKVGSMVWYLRIGDLNPGSDTLDDGVSGIQARLKNLGFDPGPIDGMSGPLTQSAIRAFQEKYPPLKVDGICGPKTWKQLKAIHGS